MPAASCGAGEQGLKPPDKHVPGGMGKDREGGIQTHEVIRRVPDAFPHLSVTQARSRETGGQMPLAGIPPATAFPCGGVDGSDSLDRACPPTPHNRNTAAPASVNPCGCSGWIFGGGWVHAVMVPAGADAVKCGSGIPAGIVPAAPCNAGIRRIRPTRVAPHRAAW